MQIKNDNIAELNRYISTKIQNKIPSILYVSSITPLPIKFDLENENFLKNLIFQGNGSKIGEKISINSRMDELLEEVMARRAATKEIDDMGSLFLNLKQQEEILGQYLHRQKLEYGKFLVHQNRYTEKFQII